MNSKEYEIIMKARELFKTGEKEEIEEALELLEDLASKKSRFAVYELARLYFEGIYIEKNIKKAFNLFVYSGELGNTKAYYDAGMIFYDNKDYKNAKRYFEQAKYSSFAKLKLGEMAIKGEGMRASKHQAFLYFSEASKLGNPDADYLVSECYLTGSGIKMDFQKGKFYLNKALRKGVEDKLNLKEKTKSKI